VRREVRQGTARQGEGKATRTCLQTCGDAIDQATVLYLRQTTRSNSESTVSVRSEGARWASQSIHIRPSLGFWFKFGPGPGPEASERWEMDGGQAR